MGTGASSICKTVFAPSATKACPAGYNNQGGNCVNAATNGASLQATSVRYFHSDHLGSITVITDEAGAVVERMAYDAWGKRRFSSGTCVPLALRNDEAPSGAKAREWFSSGTADPNDTIVGLTTDRGYTTHKTSGFSAD